jgi:hypothetical protein
MNPKSSSSPSTGPKTLIFTVLITLVVAAGTGFLGYVFGRSYGPAAPANAGAAAPAACVPADGNAREAIARRNTVWRVWNGDGDSAAPGPERAIAAALGLMLSHEANVETRNAGMRLYLNKSIAYFSADEVGAIQQTMGNGTPEQLAASFRRIADADGQAADLIRAVLADTDRVGRFTSGRLPIPLETLPDGTTP